MKKHFKEKEKQNKWVKTTLFIDKIPAELNEENINQFILPFGTPFCIKIYEK